MCVIKKHTISHLCQYDWQMLELFLQFKCKIPHNRAFHKCNFKMYVIMKRSKLFLSMLAMTAIFSFVSCEKDKEGPDNYMPNAMVTLKTNPEDGRFYMQLDDKTTLLPDNCTKSPYEKEVRAFVNYSQSAAESGEYTQSVHLNWADSIRTKSMAANRFEENPEVYGNDPVELSSSWWPTVVEDGYLTITFRTRFGYGIVHDLNLVRGKEKGEIILHHNANGDIYGYPEFGVIAFRLDDLEDITEETELTLKWNSFSGVKQMKFNYLPRKFEK